MAEFTQEDITNLIAAINSSATTIANAINEHKDAVVAASTIQTTAINEHKDAVVATNNSVITSLSDIEQSFNTYIKTLASIGVIENYWTEIGHIEALMQNPNFALDKLEQRIYDRLVQVKQGALDTIIINSEN